MKTASPKELLIAIVLVTVATLLPGCSSSRVSIRTENTTVTAVFSKNMDSTGFDMGYNPVTNEFHLKAKTLKTDASTVAQVKTAGVVAVAGAVSDAAKAITVK